MISSTDECILHLKPIAGNPFSIDKLCSLRHVRASEPPQHFVFKTPSKKAGTTLVE